MSFVQAPASGRGTRLRRALWNVRELRAGWRFAIFVALFELGILGGNALVSAALGSLDGVSNAIARKIVNLAAILTASIVMAALEGRSLTVYGLPWRRAFGIRFWQGVVFAAIALAVLVGLMAVVGVVSVHGIALDATSALIWGALYFAVFALVALEEELRFRGYALYTLASGVGFWPAAGALALLFGIGHLGNDGETWFGAINAVIGGLVFALALRRSGDLWLPIGAHLGWDWAQTYVFGVANSGNRLPGQLLDTSLSGSVWWSGGSAGPEGSVACTFVLVIAALAIAQALPARRDREPAILESR